MSALDKLPLPPGRGRLLCTAVTFRFRTPSVWLTEVNARVVFNRMTNWPALTCGWLMLAYHRKTWFQINVFSTLTSSKKDILCFGTHFQGRKQGGGWSPSLIQVKVKKKDKISNSFDLFVSRWSVSCVILPIWS